MGEKGGALRATSVVALVNCSSDQASMTIGVVPAMSERTMTCVPAMCCGGSGSNHVPALMRSWVAVALAMSASFVSIARFGVPVDPLVETTSARRSGASVG